jgi:hypothetical protein
LTATSYQGIFHRLEAGATSWSEKSSYRRKKGPGNPLTPMTDMG